jgi:hypothetical protein
MSDWFSNLLQLLNIVPNEHRYTSILRTCSCYCCLHLRSSDPPELSLSFSVLVKQSISEVNWPTRMLVPLAVIHKVRLTLLTFSAFYPCQSWREKHLKTLTLCDRDHGWSWTWCLWYKPVNLALAHTYKTLGYILCSEAWSIIMWNCNSWLVEYWKKLMTHDGPDGEENQYSWQWCFSSVRTLAFSTVLRASVLLSVNNLQLSQHHLTSYYRFPATPFHFWYTQC